MQTFSVNYEIKEQDKENKKLKESFKINAEASFGKMILDLISTGNEIIIKNLEKKEIEISLNEEVEAEDENGNIKILKNTVKKPVYNISIQIQVLKMLKNNKKICVRTKDPKLIINEGKLKIEQKKQTNEGQN